MAEKFYTVLLPEEASKRKIMDLLKTFDGVSVVFTSASRETVLARFTKTESGYREVIEKLDPSEILFDINHDNNPIFLMSSVQIAFGSLVRSVDYFKSRMRAFLNKETVMKD